METVLAAEKSDSALSRWTWSKENRGYDIEVTNSRPRPASIHRG